MDCRPPARSQSRTTGSTKSSGIKWEELPPGNYVGAAAIKDNELDGVDAATIYPAFGGRAYNDIDDRELAVACVRAYNDWLIDDFCSADPERLWSLPFMPVNDGIAAVLDEAQRVIAKGAKGLYLPLPDVAYHDHQYDPLWEVAVDAHVPVTIHRTGVSRAEMPLSMPDAAPGLNVVGTVQRFFSAINPISNLIFTGVFDRFPALIFIAAEVNCAGCLPWPNRWTRSSSECSTGRIFHSSRSQAHTLEERVRHHAR